MSDQDTSIAIDQQYQYEPLGDAKQQIRLLHVQPGQGNDPVLVRLQTETFNKLSDNRFEALSYTWGAPATPKRILIEENGRQFSKPITQNCWDALQYFRSENEVRTIWIDAICINQADVDERSQQVTIMVEMYTRALNVVVWLGLASPDSDCAISWIRLINQYVAIHPGTDRAYPLTADTRWVDGLWVPIHADETEALANLLSRPWFDRLWIWQEVLFNRNRATLVCGDTTFPWMQLCTVIWCYQRKRVPAHAATPRLISRLMYLTARVSPVRVPLLETLQNMRDCECTDQRDRVYTAQTFETSVVSLRITPNYRLSAAEIYTQFILNYIEIMEDLEFLTFCLDRSQRPSTRTPINGLPTWVPDWSQLTASFTLPPGFASARKSSVLSMNGKTIKLHGILVTKIQESSLFALDFHAQGSHEQQTAALRNLIKPYVDEKTSDNQLEQLCHVLSGGIYAEAHVPLEARWPSMEQYKRLLRRVVVMDEDSIREDDQMLGLEVITRPCFGRAFFRTADGKFGIGPANLRTNDSIAVLLGCSLSVVLRPSQLDCFELIGCAYCDGIMHGEAFLGTFPPTYRSVRVKRQDDLYYTGFENVATKDTLLEDPRLQLLPPGWKDVSVEMDVPFLLFKNVHTGEYRKATQDPRWDAHELRKRGVMLQEIELR